MASAKGPRSLALAALVLVSGCISYHRAPLPSGPDLAPAVERLSVDTASLRLAPLAPRTIDLAALTPLDVAELAVLNNPDLKAKRVALGVRGAEVFAAGLFPDPQITATVDQPIAGPDTHTAFSVSPAFDIAGMLAVFNTERAARFTARQASLDMLWAEWTTAQQARQLAETALANEARGAWLTRLLSIAKERSDRSAAALAQGDVTAQVAAVDLAAKLDIETSLQTARFNAQKARRDLDALLGLDIRVVLPLVEGPAPAGIDPAWIETALSDLPRRRPDLLALQAGYGAQDANLRKAIWAQFPLAQIAMAYARDPTPTTTLGLTAVLALPIFNGHRGEVRVQEATRAQLRAEYQARLDGAAAMVRSAEAERTGAIAAAALLAADTPRLQAMAAGAPRAYASHDLDSQNYLALMQTMLSKEADLADRRLAARIAEIQLETQLFAPPAEPRP
jgi:outer membrane protein TolC